MSVAGIMKRPVLNEADQEVGSLVDVLTNWSGEDVYPAISGLVVRVGRRRAYVPSTDVKTISAEGARLSSSKLDLREFIPETVRCRWRTRSWIVNSSISMVRG